MGLKHILKRLIKIVLLIALVFALGVGAIAFFAWQRYEGFADAPMTGIEAGETLVVEPGDSLPKVLRTLAAQGVEVDALHWRLLAKSTGAAGKIQVGEYALEPGMTFTIEPMINQGKAKIKNLKDGWTVVTADKKLSAQWEHTILVTDTGYEVLTLRAEEMLA